MSYYASARVAFVSLHQKQPSDWPNIGGDSPTLSIGSAPTSISKYSLEVGTGDPGENPTAEGFDYSEFQVVAVTLTQPSDYGSRLTLSDRVRIGFDGQMACRVPARRVCHPS
jgi:hypothetical protein